MSLFTKIEGSVVLRTNGKFFEADLYVLGENVFAKSGPTYVRLNDNNCTSVTKIFWDHIDISVPYGFVLGRMIIKPSKTTQQKSAARTGISS